MSTTAEFEPEVERRVVMRMSEADARALYYAATRHSPGNGDPAWVPLNALLALLWPGCRPDRAGVSS